MFLYFTAIIALASTNSPHLSIDHNDELPRSTQQCLTLLTVEKFNQFQASRIRSYDWSIVYS